MPIGFDHIWSAFWTLSARRTFHEGGARPLVVSEIEAFYRLSNQPLDAQTFETLIQMDDTFCHAYSVEMRADHIYRESLKKT